MWTNTLIPKNVGEPLSSRHDDRRGLGYGQTKQRFHKPRPAGNSFPYKEPPTVEDDETLDDASHAAIDKKVYDYPKLDPTGDAKATDPLYFVGAATKLRACFERIDDVLLGIAAVSRQIPIDNIHEMAVGGFSSWKAFDEKPYKRTGTKRGWSEKPPLSKIEAENETEEDEFYNLEDLSDIQRPTLGECFDFCVHT